MADRPVLYLVGSAAPPVRELDPLVLRLRSLGWDVHVILTPTAATWLDGADRPPTERTRLPPADAVLAAPLTFNTINKWAAGISDNLALGILNEAIGLQLPIWAVPHAKATLAAHPAFGESLAKLERWGVTVLPNELVRPEVKGQPFRWELLVQTLTTSA